MTSANTSMLLQLRFVVGYLGERSRHGWWQTSFFDPASTAFLMPVFAKTSRLAQYHGVVKAAQLVHDEHLNLGSYHLFRLPEEVEFNLHSALTTDAVFSGLEELFHSEVNAIKALTDFGNSAEKAKSGPVLIGESRGWTQTSVLRRVASTYLSAFTERQRSYPYFMG